MSRLLLDTHALLWAVADDRRLGAAARHALATAPDRPLISVVSLWELAMKTSIGKLQLDRPFARYVADHITTTESDILPIALPHLVELSTLPHHHRDPFDRLIVAQCTSESLTLLSADARLDAYGIKRVWD